MRLNELFARFKRTLASGLDANNVSRNTLPHAKRRIDRPTIEDRAWPRVCDLFYLVELGSSPPTAAATLE
jgi:hypothetical protein